MIMIKDHVSLITMMITIKNYDNDNDYDNDYDYYQIMFVLM